MYIYIYTYFVYTTIQSSWYVQASLSKRTLICEISMPPTLPYDSFASPFKQLFRDCLNSTDTLLATRSHSDETISAPKIKFELCVLCRKW